MDKDKDRIAVIGLGYVGLPLALLADKKGYQVIGVDIDKEKITALQNKQAIFEDEQVIQDLKRSEIDFTSDYVKIEKAKTVIICVPTPIHKDHSPDLGPLRKASEMIGKHLQPGQLVVLESTVNPGVSEDIVLPILEKGSGLKAGKDFGLAHCPERINPGDAKWNVENIDRVIGALNEEGLNNSAAFYRSILTGEVKEMGSLKEAEAVKIIENTFRDINIAFVNELAKSFDKMGIDLSRVLEGAATKPFGFLPHYPGCGIGGHCIPVDPYYLISQALEDGFDHKFLKLAREINNSMPAYTVELLTDALNELGLSVKNAKIGILGLAYKPGIDDTRESPAFEIIELLKAKQADLTIYDRFVKKGSSVSSLDELLKIVDFIVLVTAHQEFLGLTAEELKKNGIKAVIDGRNVLDKEGIEDAGIIYKGIGR